MATTIGTSYAIAVPSSWIVIWKLPSPPMSMTCLSGRPICAPMAAGRPKPIVPRPPEVMSWRGCV